MRFKRLIHRSLEFNIVFSINGVYLVAQTVKNLPTMQETQVQFLGQEDPLEKRMVAHSSILAWGILDWFDLLAV